MDTRLHFLLLLCQSCRSLRNVSFGGRILGLIKCAYQSWRSRMTSSEAPPILVLPRAPSNLNPPLCAVQCKIFLEGTLSVKHVHGHVSGVRIPG